MSKTNIPWNKGKTGMKYPNRKSPPPFTETHRKNMSKSNAWKGKKRSSESIEKFRKSMIGKKRSEEARKNMSRAHLGEKHSKEQNKKHSAWMINNSFKTFKNTQIELKIENELQRRKMNYQKQVGLCNVAKVDFYLPDYRIAIECDGCYWHNCPIHGKGEIRNKIISDKQKDAILLMGGYKVYRFWEHEINESAEACIEQIIHG